MTALRRPKWATLGSWNGSPSRSVSRSSATTGSRSRATRTAWRRRSMAGRTVRRCARSHRYRDLLARVDDGVAVLTLNRPDRRNALSRALLDALARDARGGRGRRRGRLRRAHRRRRRVLRGRRRQGHGGGRRRRAAVRRARPAPAPQPPRDRRPAAPDAQADHRGAARRGRGRRAVARAGVRPALRAARGGPDDRVRQVGFAGDYGGTWFLTQLVGPAKARELYFFSERLDAERGARARPRQRVDDAPTRCSTARGGWPPARASRTGT